MRTNRKKGKWGEIQALHFLKKKGFHILEQNFRAERGEIDLIALDGETLVFVEVKFSSQRRYGPPELRVDKRKQRQLAKIAQAYLETHPVQFQECRFDVVAIESSQNQTRISHFQDAFWIEPT